MGCVDDGDTAWMMISTVLVLGMIPGLALFESGLLRTKNALSVIMQVISGVLVLSTMWLIFGFSLTFGPSLSGVIGNIKAYPLMTNLPEGFCLPFAKSVPGVVYGVFQMMFASITPLLQTGAIAGRMKFSVYFVYIILWELLVYYPLAHWIWGGGWLSPLGATFNGAGVIDFAGGIVIHISSGTASIIAAKMLGNRYGFEKNLGAFRPSNLNNALLGAAFLWMGWFGFNAGSAGDAGSLTAVVIVNTQMAACVSGLIWMLLDWWIDKHPSLVETLNGVVAGLAGITPASGFIAPPWTLLVSVMLGVTSFFGVTVLKGKLQIDDALDVVVVHGWTSLVGSLANGFFASTSINPNGQSGLVDGRPIQIAFQLLGISISMAWSGFWSFLILKALGYLFNGIRVPLEAERDGLGWADHGEFMDDFEFFHRKKFLDLTLETVNTHSSAVRYQVSSDEEDLVMEHTDTEYRSDRRASESSSHLPVAPVRRPVVFSTDKANRVASAAKISINTARNVGTSRTKNLLESDSEDPFMQHARRAGDL